MKVCKPRRVSTFSVITSPLDGLQFLLALGNPENMNRLVLLITTVWLVALNTVRNGDYRICRQPRNSFDISITLGGKPVTLARPGNDILLFLIDLRNP